MKISIKECPYCKSKSGFETQIKVKGDYQMWTDFNDKNVHSQYTEGMTEYGKLSTPTCVDCGKNLGRWIKEEEVARDE